MARSLNLANYMALARRGGAAGGAFEPSAKRPEGSLIWVHATTLEHAKALIQITGRLSAQRGAPGGGPHLLLTVGEDVTLPRRLRADVIRQPLVGQTQADADAFMAYWRPDICLWTGGDLRPALINAADGAGVPLILIDAEAAMLERPGWRWLPDGTPALLSRFRRIMARSEQAARHIVRLGVDATKVTANGPLQEGTSALPYAEPLREEMATSLRGRPIWLAAELSHSEFETILEAHRQASRLAHRLFLIAVPADASETEAFRATLRRGNWRHAIWSHGGMPGEATQVLLDDTRADMGLWYRLATIAMMGSSLMPGMGGSDPNEPAAHGAAIVYGPHVSRYMASYRRYASVGGARIVRDAGTLAAALSHLIAADQSAAMAHAAWEVATQGAEAADQVLALLHDRLDDLEWG